MVVSATFILHDFCHYCGFSTTVTNVRQSAKAVLVKNTIIAQYTVYVCCQRRAQSTTSLCRLCFSNRQGELHDVQARVLVFCFALFCCSKQLLHPCRNHRWFSEDIDVITHDCTNKGFLTQNAGHASATEQEHFSFMSAVQGTSHSRVKSRFCGKYLPDRRGASAGFG